MQGSANFFETFPIGLTGVFVGVYGILHFCLADEFLFFLPALVDSLERPFQAGGVAHRLVIDAHPDRVGMRTGQNPQGDRGALADWYLEAQRVKRAVGKDLGLLHRLTIKQHLDRDRSRAWYARPFRVPEGFLRDRAGTNATGGFFR